MQVAYLAIALPIVLWIGLRLLLPKGPYEMDTSGLKGTFFPVMVLYSVFFYLIAVASGVIVAFTPHTWVTPVLMNAGLDALLFNGLLILHYESYLAQRYPKGPMPGIIGQGPSNYTVGKYAAILSLGFGSFIEFGLGVIYMVYGVGR